MSGASGNERCFRQYVTMTLGMSVAGVLGCGVQLFRCGVQLFRPDPEPKCHCQIHVHVYKIRPIVRGKS
eukprot:2764714-Rhodomonas_salina.1